MYPRPKNGKAVINPWKFKMNLSQRSMNSTHRISPNYPLQEPVFIVPNVPDLTKVPEPKPPKRPPAPGYDMRTLRKQIEFLHAVRGFLLLQL